MQHTHSSLCIVNTSAVTFSPQVKKDFSYIQDVYIVLPAVRLITREESETPRWCMCVYTEFCPTNGWLGGERWYWQMKE